jgi:hypothetical protein
VEGEDFPIPSELPILKNKAETFRKGRIFVLPLEGFYLYKVFILYIAKSGMLTSALGSNGIVYNMI